MRIYMYNVHIQTQTQAVIYLFFNFEKIFTCLFSVQGCTPLAYIFREEACLPQSFIGSAAVCDPGVHHFCV